MFGDKEQFQRLPLFKNRIFMHIAHIRSADAFFDAKLHKNFEKFFRGVVVAFIYVGIKAPVKLFGLALLAV